MRSIKVGEGSIFQFWEGVSCIELSSRHPWDGELGEEGGIMMLWGPPCFGDRLDTSLGGRVSVVVSSGWAFADTFDQDTGVLVPEALGIVSSGSTFVVSFPFGG